MSCDANGGRRADKRRTALHPTSQFGIDRRDGRHTNAPAIGVQFPGPEDLLIRRRLIFGAAALPVDTPVQVGRAGDWLCFRVDNWSLLFAIDHASRFPAVDDCVRSAAYAMTSLQVDSLDAKRLRTTLQRVPRNHTQFGPVIIDANTSLKIRSESKDPEQALKVLLPDSTRSGRAQRIKTAPKYLCRALELGFRTLHVFAPDQPILCQDARRDYVWAVLTPSEPRSPKHEPPKHDGPSVIVQSPKLPSDVRVTTYVMTPAQHTQSRKERSLCQFD